MVQLKAPPIGPDTLAAHGKKNAANPRPDDLNAHTDKRTPSAGAGVGGTGGTRAGQGMGAGQSAARNDASGHPVGGSADGPGVTVTAGKDTGQHADAPGHITGDRPDPKTPKPEGGAPR
ncbi:MAG TPA: hypothetical protein VEY95_06315 [Azospirillaceae bacterium]|nr:hypothetical protein [Azospirillaceae bacterium]